MMSEVVHSNKSQIVNFIVMDLLFALEMMKLIFICAGGIEFILIKY